MGVEEVTLPPLPLIDGCLFIDNSAWIEGLTTCHRFLQYKSLNLRIPTNEKPSLNFGSCIHLVLEHRYRKYGTGYVGEQFWNEVGDITTAFFAEHPCPVDDWRNANWLVEIVKHYVEKYPMEDFALLTNEKGQPMLELPFTIELYRHKDIKVIYCGRIDLPLIAGGNIIVMDHKTSSRLGQEFFDRMRMSSQQKGYCWSFEQITGFKVTGYCVNAIRTKEAPLYVQKGTTWIGSDKKGGKKSSTPADWWNETLQRESYVIKPGELSEWKENTIALCEEFFFNYDRGYMPMETTLGCTAWGQCPFYEVCTLPPSDRDLFLQSGKYANNEWTPLHEVTAAKQ